MDRATAFFEPLCYMIDGHQTYVPAPPALVEPTVQPPQAASDSDPFADSEYDTLMELYNEKLEQAAKLVD
ncbi:Hypothetical protein GLP15_3066 [Giardia lamblia P15]|uniref:Uncharacterized protein n=1 Tax=Giardia intestinalis (strain P15) TaxID=658858 RepID=E1F943_GIAIA|nr:Hypothetical protein GLP15_3066 [Giardia lamblia P15]